MVASVRQLVEHAVRQLHVSGPLYVSCTSVDGLLITESPC